MYWWYIFFIGIVDLWYSHVEYAITTHRRIIQGNTYEPERRVFTMDDMQTAFYILFVGLLLSTFVFFTELYINKRKQPKPFQFVH